VKSALQSLLAVMVLVCGLGFFAWVYLRHDADLQDHKVPLDHAFLHAAHKDIVAYHVAPPPNQRPYSPAHLELLKALPPEVVIWVDIRERMDGTLIASDNATNTSHQTDDAPTLDQALEALGSHRLILNFHDNRPTSLQKISAAVEKAHAADRILVQSPEDGILKDLREAKPLWLFGTSLAQVTRLIMMSSIGLTGLSPLRGDVLVVESQAKEHLLERLSDSVISEIQRRKMKIYAGPASAEESQSLWKRGVDGVLTSQPEALLQAAGFGPNR
jgi:hypothetical protein